MPLGWIDFSKADRARALSILEMLSESAALDELGVAPIRDGFANIFFPGTSTIQTRAKYFFIVPYALKDLERQATHSPTRLMEMLNAKEKECARTFLRNNKSEIGIIGNRSLLSCGWVKRSPADIYWNGLLRYGFLRKNISLAAYLNAIHQLKTAGALARNLGKQVANEEDDIQDDERFFNAIHQNFWSVPTYKDKWFEDLKIELTQDEGQFLKEQIIRNCKNSMLAHILENNLREVLDCGVFDNLEEIIEKFPEAMRRDYLLALDFAKFFSVILTVFNIIISDGKNEFANEKLARQEPAFPRLAEVDIEGIMTRIAIVDRKNLKPFLLEAQKLMRANDLAAIKRLIRNREIFLKGENRAKTAHPGQFDEWLGSELYYRFGNAKRILRDIFASQEEAQNAQPQ